MRKSLIVALTALGGSASYAAGGKIAPDPVTSDPAVWRWHVSSILDDQGSEKDASFQSASAAKFEQGYMRYSTLGQPERR